MILYNPNVQSINILYYTMIYPVVCKPNQTKYATHT